MHLLDDIFDAFGGTGKLADATGIPPQTVCDWRKGKRPNIPHWRRSEVLSAARRLNVDLPTDAIAYLSSRERLAA